MMKFAVLLVVAFFWQNQNVHGHDFFKVITMKFGAITDTITTTFDDFFTRVKRIFTPRYDVLPMPVDQSLIEDKIKQSFNEFVERTAADTLDDPENMEYINMRSEPTALMSTPQLATLHGKSIESHVIKTRDGYLLTLHRIISNNYNESKQTNETVLLHHGLLGSSADWILLGPEKSLPYLLSNAGYDVWMVNARGSYYSRGHISLPVNSLKFWKFSWQEMGEYDLPAVIDYIRKLRNYTVEINYIGHSMGATALMVLLSTTPRYNRYIRMGILLAPLVFVNNIQGPFKILTTMAATPPDQLLKTIGDTEFLPSRKIPKMLSKRFCQGPQYYCNNPLLFFTGGLPEDERLNASFLARLLYHVPAGGSTNTIVHYSQVVRNGKFHRFKQPHADFPLQQVTAPIVIFSSTEDWLAPITDVLRLYFSISNPLDHYVIRDKNLSHTEFVWGIEADVLVFPKIMDYLENGLVQEVPKDNDV